MSTAIKYALQYHLETGQVHDVIFVKPRSRHIARRQDT